LRDFRLAGDTDIDPAEVGKDLDEIAGLDRAPTR